MSGTGGRKIGGGFFAFRSIEKGESIGDESEGGGVESGRGGGTPAFEVPRRLQKCSKIDPASADPLVSILGQAREDRRRRRR